MTTPSFFEQMGFMLHLEKPLWVSDAWQILEYRRNIQTYSQNIVVNGGYWDATIVLSMTRAEAESIFSRSIGRDATLFDNRGKFFNGFVDTYEINYGAFTVMRGPLLNVANHVRAAYSVLDTSDVTNIVGMREITPVAQDTTSQNLYGIHQRVLSVGGSTELNAEQIRDTHIEENKDPESTQRISLGASGRPVVVTFTIAGYAQLFEKYILENASTGEQNADVKIEWILGQDPNGIFSTDYSKIDVNATQVPILENEYRTAWQGIKSAVSKGDSSFNRWVFGVYLDRIAQYNQIPLTVEYEFKVADKQQAILGAQGRVDPWRVLPGKWCKVSDVLPGAQSPINPSTTTELRNDPRMIFIESAAYSSPNSLNLEGSKVGQSQQLLARLGLGGGT